MPSKLDASLWIVEPLGKQHNRRDFSCGQDALDRYLKEQAGQDARRRIAAPFALTHTLDRNTLIGYYTLSASGIDLQDLPQEVIKKLPAYPVIPVTLLGRLAVDERHMRQGAGEHLLVDALERALTQSSQIAAAAVVVDAIDDHAGRFYQHFGFIPFPDKPGRLFLTMKTITKLFTGS